MGIRKRLPINHRHARSNLCFNFHDVYPELTVPNHDATRPDSRLDLHYLISFAIPRCMRLWFLRRNKWPYVFVSFVGTAGLPLIKADAESHSNAAKIQPASDNPPKRISWLLF